MDKKKKRGSNYTMAEKELLLQLIKKYHHILENKQTSVILNFKKREAWDSVCQQYNTVAGSGFRTWRQLRHLYENLKQRAKKNIAKENRLRFNENTDVKHIEIKVSADELAEFQADEEEEFGAAARANTSRMDSSNPDRTTSTPRRTTLRVAASAPPPLPPSAHPMMWPEELTPRIRPGVNADECQIFGDFVASELRTLRSDESRKKLKRVIQKAILQIGEEEDMSING
ncbi:uncharacterized protein LOC128683799 isoform X2 [Plodia interpunctella]|uniref:uncharacterized protein LOC128683799 isoform X2 n=1 Tax=Plodia interpunctella TaxID=58824 RepID=UPI002367A2B7|nr:uncharacterized protein LOC128683799 isoform X2 [Plodia interpunctella]